MWPSRRVNTIDLPLWRDFQNAPIFSPWHGVFTFVHVASEDPLEQAPMRPWSSSKLVRQSVHPVSCNSAKPFVTQAWSGSAIQVTRELRSAEVMTVLVAAGSAQKGGAAAPELLGIDLQPASVPCIQLRV
jgi:hypothetical protein